MSKVEVAINYLSFSEKKEAVPVLFGKIYVVKDDDHKHS